MKHLINIIMILLLFSCNSFKNKEIKIQPKVTIIELKLVANIPITKIWNTNKTLIDISTEIKRIEFALASANDGGIICFLKYTPIKFKPEQEIHAVVYGNDKYGICKTDCVLDIIKFKIFKEGFSSAIIKNPFYKLKHVTRVVIHLTY